MQFEIGKVMEQKAWKHNLQEINFYMYWTVLTVRLCAAVISSPKLV